MDDLRLRERPSAGAARCPFCHDAIRTEDPGLLRCGGCEAPLHATCAIEAGACASCGRGLALDALPEADRACTFAHACGARATAGDGLCRRHRLAVNAPADDLGRAAAARAELEQLARGIDWTGRILFSVGGLVSLLGPLAVLWWAGDGLPAGGAVLVLLLGAALVSFLAATARYLRRQARGLRAVLAVAATDRGAADPRPAEGRARRGAEKSDPGRAPQDE